MVNGVSARHPDYTGERDYEFKLMRDTLSGVRAVKAKGETYLLKPAGFKSMDDGGAEVYEKNYKFHAIVPELVAPTIGAMIGVIHDKETQINLPDALAGIWENADGEGAPLDAFHRRITRNLLWLGRYGVMASAPENGGEPYLVGYSGDSIINWDRDFYVLNESGSVRKGFEWETVEKYRVLSLENGRFVSTIYEGSDSSPISVIEPEGTGARPIGFIPFAVGNAIDTTQEIKSPPLVGVADATISAYQLSADWRWQLYMSGQETMVITNATNPPEFVGAGAIYRVNAADGAQVDVKYVGPNCIGIEKHDQAIRKQVDAAIMAGAKLLDNQERVQESGEARRMRFAAETASLMSVAHVSCAMLERGLRFIGRMKGLPDAAIDEIVVKPPEDLLDNAMSAQDFAALFGVYQNNGMSWETYYERGQQGGIFSTERDADDEWRLLDGPGEDGDATSSFSGVDDVANQGLGDA